MSLLTAVVTGANRGLGLEIVRQLCADQRYGDVFALCRGGSDALHKLAESDQGGTGKVIIAEGVDVAKDEVTEVLQRIFSPATAGGGSEKRQIVKVDLLVHNAGAYGPPQVYTGVEHFTSSQSLNVVTMDAMRFCFELNTLGPLRVTRALLPNLVADPAPPGKVIIISSLMGSCEDNTSGSHYAYRTAKAGVNMIGRSLAMDLKKEEVPVGLVHPGMVATGFTGEGIHFPGMRDVEPAVKGVLEAIDSITMDTTGTFVHGNYGEGVKACPW